jgi:hypothetical protein
MSRVEPKETPYEKREAEQGRRAQHDTPPIGHTPSKAEGEERDVEEALRRQERNR